MNEVLTFKNAELVYDGQNIRGLPAADGFESEGNLARAWIKYRNGDCSVTGVGVPDDETLYFPVWMPETCCPKTEKDVLAEQPLMSQLDDHGAMAVDQ